MSDKKGYLPIFRKFLDNPFWTEKRVFSRAEAWLDILFQVRYSEEPDEEFLGDKKYICNQGESLNSLLTWSKRWNWTKSRVKRFLELLKRENMIDFSCDKKTTHLKVLKYKYYRDLAKHKQNTNETQTKHKRNTNETQMNIEEKGNKETREQNVKKKPQKELDFNSVFEKLNNRLNKEELKNIIIEFVENRRDIKKPMTELALKKLINKLNKYSLSDCMEQINRSIINGWQDVYLDNVKTYQPEQPKKKLSEMIGVIKND